MRNIFMMAAITSVVLLPTTSAQSDPISSDPTVTGNSSGSRTQITGEASETIELPDSPPGEPPSQERPTVQASDPSMWEEQSHRECSPEKDAYGLDKYKCNLANLHRPTQPDQHTATGVTTTLTTTWTTRYRPQSENQWRPIEGTITTTETSTPYDLVRIVTYLTDDAEEAQGH